MKNAHGLIKKVTNLKNNWDERSQFTIEEENNLSMSDLDSIELYATTFIVTGSFRNLVTPMGSIAKVLAAYGMEEKSGPFGW